MPVAAWTAQGLPVADTTPDRLALVEKGRALVEELTPWLKENGDPNVAAVAALGIFLSVLPLAAGEENQNFFRHNRTRQRLGRRGDRRGSSIPGGRTRRAGGLGVGHSRQGVVRHRRRPRSVFRRRHV